MISTVPLSSEQPRERIEVIDALRGLAALSVAWFHISHALGLTTPGSLLYLSGSKGWAGVEVFFVISGFVIPFTLMRNKYRVRNFGRFMLKRFIRLDPPYFVSIVAVLCLAAAYSPDGKIPFSTPQILLHVGYLNVFSGYHWIDPTYWTLAVEVQYYILVGLAFPLLINERLFWFVAMPVSVGLAFLLKNHDFVFQYLPLFMIGVASLHYRRKRIRPTAFVLVCIALAVVTYLLIGRAPALAGLATGVIIATVNSTPRVLVIPGSISYSLYLIHVAATRVVARIAGPQATVPGQLALTIGSLFASLAAAWMLYRFVERPSRRLSSRISYEPGRPAQAQAGF